MILEYYRRTGDREILKRYRADVDIILEYFDRHIGSYGLVENLGYWDFVDWQELWQPTAGRPGTVMEGPSYEEFTQHAQSWAVLNGMLTQEEARRVMRRTFEEKDVLRCYFSTSYELFRACEKAGCYELTGRQMDWWIRLPEEHCVACPETPANDRSECHAWSALPMYELLSVIAGIRRESGNPDLVDICPHMDYVPDLEGRMITEYGAIEFCYTPTDYGMCYEITLPDGMSGSFTFPSGQKRELKNGRNKIEDYNR